MKNVTDVVPGLQSGGAVRADQNAWLKNFGVDVEAIQSAARAAARGSAPQPTQSRYPTSYTTYGEQSAESEPTSGPGARSTPPSIAPTASQAAEPAQRSYTMTTYGEQSTAAASTPPSLNVAPSSAPSLNADTSHYVMAPTDDNPRTHVVATETPSEPAQGTRTHYQEFREPEADAPDRGPPTLQEPEAADPAQQAFPGASNYMSAPPLDRTQSLDTPDDDDDDSDDEDDGENGPYGQATESSGDDARAADPLAEGGGDDGEIEPHTPVETGMKTKRVDAKYDGEHNKAGWRQEIWKVDAENTRITTKLYSEEEQAANRLVQKPGGKFKMGDGQATDNLQKGFAMDETGRMVAFKEDVREKITPDPYDGEERREETTDHPTKVVRSDPDARVEITHHSSVLGAEKDLDEHGNMRSKPAALAGTVKFNNAGQIETITNQSGHYKPTVDYLLQGVEHLMKQGAFFEDEVVRMTDDVAEGEKYKPLKDSDPDYKLYKSVQAKLAGSKKLAAQVRTLSEALDKEEDEKKAAEIGGQLEKLKGEIDTLKALVDKSQEVLRKKGVGPSNRLRWDARAEFVDVKPGMTGAQVHAAQTATQRVGDFLATGGDYQKKGDKKTQAERKTEMLKEVEQNPKPRPFAPTGGGSLEEQAARKKAALEALSHGTLPPKGGGKK